MSKCKPGLDDANIHKKLQTVLPLTNWSRAVNNPAAVGGSNQVFMEMDNELQLMPDAQTPETAVIKTQEAWRRNSNINQNFSHKLRQKNMCMRFLRH